MSSASSEAPMASQKRPRSRKSIAHLPSPDAGSEVEDKENIGADVLSAVHLQPTTAGATKKKSRSKSFGPGGLDALREDTGNRRKVRLQASLFVYL